jgi:hypothetical protein
LMKDAIVNYFLETDFIEWFYLGSRLQIGRQHSAVALKLLFQ